MRNGQHWPNSQAPHAFLAMDRNLSFCGHWGGRNLCRSIDPYPSFEPTPLHYWFSSTNGGRIHLNHSLNGASSVTLITCLGEVIQLSLLGSKGKYHGTLPGETRQNVPAQVAMLPIHSDPTSWIVSPLFVSWSALVPGCLGPCLLPLLFQAASVPWAPMWLQLLLPLGPSSSESEDTLYYSYDSDILAAIVHLSISILYCQALGQWYIFGT